MRTALVLDDGTTVAMPTADELPLHYAEGTPDDAWWACEHPERRSDGTTRYDIRCRACALAMWAELLQREGEVIAAYYRRDGHRSFGPTREVARAALRDLHGVSV